MITFLLFYDDVLDVLWAVVKPTLTENSEPAPLCTKNGAKFSLFMKNILYLNLPHFLAANRTILYPQQSLKWVIIYFVLQNM